MAFIKPRSQVQVLAPAQGIILRMSPIEILGIVSALVTLAAFVANEMGYLTTEDFSYDFLNMISSMGLFAYAYSTGVVPFMLTNSVWFLVSATDVVRYLFRKKKRRRLK